MSGYVRIHRSLIGHPAFRNDAEAMAFAWLVAKAAWQPSKVRYKGHDIELERGQLTVSIRDFAEALDRPKGWVERLFARLREHGMIAQKNGTQVGTQVGTHGGTIGGTPAAVITICNYAAFQGEDRQCETPRKTPSETAARQRRDTEQEREEGKKEEELSPNGDCPSDDEPKLLPEHVFEFYKELAASLGKPVPRDFTPERRQMVRARIAQHPLEDFQTVFAKCRDSPFLRGDKVRGPLSIDWLMKKGNFQKTLEGNYDG